ncbi:VanW family protein [Sporanaerobium hydrogeniformans]|uniref:VanW family protein n=1 Tax=Sporanaerobium hydrogeniformans TaxID=3072179 RepID=UPI0015D47853|nr:VanW family protein [Sporanaerobium hydrogeniformans]
MSKMRTFKWIILITCIVLAGIALGTAIYIYTEVSKFDKVFASNIWVEDFSISGLTYEEAQEKLEAYCKEQDKGKSLILSKKQVAVDIPFNALGFTYAIKEVLDEAYEIGHQGNLLERYHYAKMEKPTKHTFELTKTYNKNKLTEIIASKKEAFYIAPIDATITRKNRAFIITSEIPGEELDLPLTVERVAAALENTSEVPIKVEVVTKEVPVQFTKESFNPIQQPIASFYTSYNNADPDRNINLKVAADKINKQLLPGETFSLAQQLEPINFEAGYRNSKVIVNGKLEQGIGGGVCQIASTLYNALLLTNVDINMRQNHSLPVAYVPLGRDATYASGAIDFQFKNNSNLPLFVESFCENNKVYVNIFASPTLKPENTIKFTSEITEVIPAPQPQRINDPELEEGTEVEEVTALDGKRVKLYRLFYDKNNKLINKEIINSSYYRPRAAVIKVGSKKTTQPTFNTQEHSLPIQPTNEQPFIDFELPGIEEPLPSPPLDDSFIKPQN